MTQLRSRDLCSLEDQEVPERHRRASVCDSLCGAPSPAGLHQPLVSLAVCLACLLHNQMCPLFSELRTYMIETKKLLLGQTPRKNGIGVSYCSGEVGVGESRVKHLV